MPYITKVARDRVCPDGYGDGLAANRVLSLAENKGEFNFEISALIDSYITQHGRSYQVISDAIGAAEDAAAECRRTVLAVYEEEKRRENGEVYSAYVLGRI